MNYLNLKKRFPKSTTAFFYWVTEQNPDGQNDYVDNVYFYQFFSEYFEYRQTPYGTLFIDREKPYFTKLKGDIVLRSGSENYDYFFGEGRIICNRYSDTGGDYIKISVRHESDFESAFFVLERLIENEFYVGK